MEIIFAGASHYGLNGYRSLFPFFEKIYLVADNIEEILDEKREQDEVIEDFESVACRYVFLCGYSRPIDKSRLEKKTYLNVHGSLLPKYRGMHATFYAIMNGEKELGITFHLVNPYMDAGDILAQFPFPYVGQTVQDINDMIDALVYQHAGKVLSEFILGRIKPVPQNDSEALFGAKRSVDDCLIDFMMSNTLLRRFFQALTPGYPYPMLSIRGELYEVLPDVQIVDKDYYGPLGRVVNMDAQGVWIKTQDGFLIVSRVRKYGTDKTEDLAQFIPIGYRFFQLGGNKEELSGIDDMVTNYIAKNGASFPDRWKKYIAFFYPDARIRKQFLQYLNVYLGEGSYANIGLHTDSAGAAPVYIGKNVSIAPDVCFITDSVPNNSKILSEIPYVKERLIQNKSIVIEDDVWIGAGVIILPGVRIGKCSIIGAGAVVINDVKEYAIYAGVPAKLLREISH